MALTPYQRDLLVLLSVATFFEGFDIYALAQVLPQIRAEWGLDELEAGVMIGVVNVGTILAMLVTRQADILGRKPVLTVTIIGYTLCTLGSGLAPGPVTFALAQLAARVFLVGEWGVAMVVAAEEFPTERRGFVLGVLQGIASIGAIVCSAVVPLLLHHTPWGWRSVFFVGSVPLVVAAVARRSLRETGRFLAAKEAGTTSTGDDPWRIWRTVHRGRIFQLGLIWALTYLCTASATTFWKDFAVSERGFTDGQVGVSLTIAAVVSMPMVFGAGKLFDVIGRRRGAVVVFLATTIGVFGAYTLHEQAPLTVFLTIGLFGFNAVLPVLNAWTTELFPTELRGDAYAAAHNLLGRPGYVLSPILVGVAATAGDIGYGVVAYTAIFPLLALLLIWRWLPETSGKDLEATAFAH